DIALVKNHLIALVFLPAADIPTFVGEGRVDLGITGKDQICEYEALKPPTKDTGLKEIIDLQHGYCKLQVQVPKDSPFKDAKDLIGHDISTSFPGLTRSYFGALEAQLLDPNRDCNVVMQSKTKIKYLGGSVEASCKLGVADGIVDLVESGDTMRAAGLKAIATVAESNAVLIRSEHPSNQPLLNKIARRIDGFVAAHQYSLCIYNIPRSLLAEATRITPGKRAPTIMPLDDPDWVAVSAMVEMKKISDVMDDLANCGAEDVFDLNPNNSRYTTRPGNDY
ncbi:MAG: hypothetical protein Q9180_008806, partial [Flavoplaca navasiana]